MFTGKKVVTRGLANEVGQLTIMYLWNLVVKFCNEDYLIVINIDNGKITLSQEQPEKTETFDGTKFFKDFCPELLTLKTKIYAIDDVDYCTMLFPDER